jgi:hypothetical protein
VPPADEQPLPVRLSRVIGQLTRDVESAAGVGDSVPSLAVWSNVLRCVADAEPDWMDERDLPAQARISRRLAVSAVTGAARRAWIETEVITGKHRRVRLAALGTAAAQTWPEHLTALDAKWAASDLRGVIEALVARLPLELPHFPATYGSADVSAIGAPYSNRTGSGRLHGTDWTPVPRGDGDTVTLLPITALLSQALGAFTIDYEDQFQWPLANTTLVLVHLSSEPRPLADVPGRHEITGNGKSLTERHGITTVTRDPDDPRRNLVALTPRGAAVLQHHPARLEATEKEWRARYGGDIVDGLRAALAPVAARAESQPDHVLAPLHLG